MDGIEYANLNIFILPSIFFQNLNLFLYLSFSLVLIHYYRVHKFYIKMKSVLKKQFSARCFIKNVTNVFKQNLYHNLNRSYVNLAIEKIDTSYNYKVSIIL